VHRFVLGIQAALAYALLRLHYRASLIYQIPVRRRASSESCYIGPGTYRWYLVPSSFLFRLRPDLPVTTYLIECPAVSSDTSGLHFHLSRSVVVECWPADVPPRSSHHVPYLPVVRGYAVTRRRQRQRGEAITTTRLTTDIHQQRMY
jgi:hypothetical protein